MKKIFLIATLTFALILSLLIGVAAHVYEVKSVSYNSLAFEVYNKYASPGMEPFMTINEINKKVESIPPAMKPYLKMIIKNAPRPQNGLNVKVFSRSYTVYFKNDRDWELFKKTVLKVITFE